MEEFRVVAILVKPFVRTTAVEEFRVVAMLVNLGCWLLLAVLAAAFNASSIDWCIVRCLVSSIIGALFQ